MNENETILFGTGVHGTKVWKIWSKGNSIIIEANGATYFEDIAGGLAGRSLDEQIKLRINARVRSKLDDGFKRDKSKLGKTITNQLGLARPMLATHLKDCRHKVNDDWFVQPKLDGHRCLIDKTGAYSRAGRPIDTITEIIEELQIPEGVTFDGELYCHGQALQTISSWAKRRQKATANLQYHIYDVMIPGLSFKLRQEFLDTIEFGSPYIRKVTTDTIGNIGNLTEYFNKVKSVGYEGLILRPPTGLYESGKRSKTLIKVKSRLDAEFKCIDILPTKWGWGNLVLLTKEGLSFKTPAPGTLAEKTKQLINKELYIGRFVTCEFADWTIEKKPFHCVAIRWREDI